jgi:hypothetical protein
VIADNDDCTFISQCDATLPDGEEQNGMTTLGWAGSSSAGGVAVVGGRSTVHCPRCSLCRTRGCAGVGGHRAMPARTDHPSIPHVLAHLFKS